MRIKFLSSFLVGMTLVGATSCKDDITLSGDGNTGNNSGSDYPALYMSLGVNYADVAGSRSSTTDEGDDYVSSDGGMEYSSLDEYDVRTAIIVLAKKDTYDYLTHADVTGILASNRDENTGNGPISPENFYQFATIGRFKYSDIANLYDEEGTLKPEYKDGVNVFVFCNPTGDLLHRFETTDFTQGTNATDWVNWTGIVEQEPSLPGYTPSITNSIWAPRSFLMSNAKPAFAELPGKLSNWDYYNQEDPFDLSGPNREDDPDNSDSSLSDKKRGPIYVERSVARLDLKADKTHLQGISASWAQQPGAEWRYQILGGLSSSMHDGTDGSTFNFIDVQLTRISLVNMSKEFHFLRRVSNTGIEDGKGLMGVERSFNYVVDTDALRKQSEGDAGYTYANAHEGFNFALFTNKESSANPALSRDFAYDRNGWFTDNISDVMSNGKYDNTGSSDKYNVWRYMTENTIPQDAGGGNSRQVAIQSTGVVFKGLILPGEDIDKTFVYDGSSTINGQNRERTLRYIPEEVVNALLASKYHLPKHGTGANESTGTKWEPESSPMAEKEKQLQSEIGKNLSFDYPTLYVFQGSIYAGFKTVVMQAQLYDGVGGLMYNAVNSTLSNWWANLDDLENGGTATFVWKGSSFDNEDDNWIQLNVDRYNKIVNGFTGEPIVLEVPIDQSSKRFKINLDENDPNFRSLLTSGSDASRFTMYDASFEDTSRGGAGWGYYCYYFWWFKHNDNGIDGRMGPMEFATVRNNVYKLSVTKISSLGHSVNTLNDPDPLTPDTPDEDDKVYIDVNMKIVPWVVRYNKVEF